MTRLRIFLVGLTLALTACGSAPLSTSTDGGEDDSAGDEVVAVLDFTVPDCSNSGQVEAFGRTWNQTTSIPNESWRERAPLEGILRFTSFEAATFEVDGESVEMTHTGEIDAMCEEWATEDPQVDPVPLARSLFCLQQDDGELSEDDLTETGQETVGATVDETLRLFEDEHVIFMFHDLLGEPPIVEVLESGTEALAVYSDGKGRRGVLVTLRQSGSEWSTTLLTSCGGI